MLLDNLKKYRVILASKSPRRQELIDTLRIPYTVVTIGGIDESYPDDMPPKEVPAYLAAKKGDEYARRLECDDLIITADTLVICDGRIMGKPKSIDEAVEMLMFLQGKTHIVVTGVCITTGERRSVFSSETKVTFATLTEEEARYYAETYTPLDKAGAYGIQEWIGSVAVESIEGSFYNVMGLPVNRLYRELKTF